MISEIFLQRATGFLHLQKINGLQISLRIVHVHIYLEIENHFLKQAHSQKRLQMSGSALVIMSVNPCVRTGLQKTNPCFHQINPLYPIRATKTGGSLQKIAENMQKRLLQPSNRMTTSASKGGRRKDPVISVDDPMSSTGNGLLRRMKSQHFSVQIVTTKRSADMLHPLYPFPVSSALIRWSD